MPLGNQPQGGPGSDDQPRDDRPTLDQRCQATTTQILQFEFADHAATEAIETMVVLATAAVEGIHGCTAVRLEAAFVPILHQKLIEIDDALETGRHFARALYFMLGRTMGPKAFKIRRIPRGDRPQALPEWVETL